MIQNNYNETIYLVDMISLLRILRDKTMNDELMYNKITPYVDFYHWLKHLDTVINLN